MLPHTELVYLERHEDGIRVNPGWEVEITHRNDGPFGWKAEVSEAVGIRNFAGSRASVLRAVRGHLNEMIKRANGNPGLI